MKQKNRDGVARLVVLTVALCAAYCAVADVWNDGAGHDWTYEINGEEATITAVTETGTTTAVSGEIEIPSTLGGTVVTGFGSVFRGNKGITAVKIPDGVTMVGYQAFYECSSLQAVELPSCVTSIGYESFYGCTRLASVELPECLSSIDDHAFSGSGLKNVVIPQSVVSVGFSAFDSCEGLESVDIQAQISNLSPYLFYGCGKLSSVTLPDSLKSIDSQAFTDCVRLANITLPPDLEIIGVCAFWRCSALEQIVFPEKLSAIGEWGFNSCGKLSIVDMGKCAATFGKEVFWGCLSLSDFKVDPDNNAYSSEAGVLYDKRKTRVVCCPIGIAGEIVVADGVTQIGADAFNGCLKLTRVTLPDSVVSIGESAFRDCTRLSDITLGGGVATLDGNVFAGCTNLQRIGVSSENAVYASYDGVVYDKGLITVIACPPGRSTAVEICNGVKIIGKAAFQGCAQLPAVSIPHGVEKIGDFAFESCNCIKNIEIPNTVTNLGHEAFSSSGLVEIGMPASVTVMGESVCENCTSLTTARVSGSVGRIMYGAFANCLNLENVTLDNGIREIGLNAFANCVKLGRIALPDTLTEISDDAFVNCTSLTTITLPDCLGTVKGFGGCLSLREVIVGKDAWRIGNGAFLLCGNLERVVFNGNGLTEIGRQAFANCKNLKNIVLPDSVRSIGQHAFYGSALKHVVLPNQLTDIGDASFSACGALTGIVIPESVSCIGAGSFRDCTALSKVIFLGNAPTMGDAVFVGSVACGYVMRDSTGWGVDIPGKWNAITLNYIDNYSIVSFDTNRGEPVDDVYINIPTEPVESLPVPTRSGCRFVGWFTAAEGGDEVFVGAPLPNDVATLYAHWQEVVVAKVGDVLAWANTNTGGAVWDGTAINECNFDFMIPASDELPAGAKVRIRKIRFASLNSSFVDWDATNNRSDPYRIRLNGVNSEKYEFGGTIASGDGRSDSAIEFAFSTACDVVVGRKYSAVSGNNVGEIGNGLAFLYSNGKLVYGSNADRASVRYVKTGDAQSILSTTTAASVTGEAGYYPVYEIEAELVSLEPSALDALAFEYTGIRGNHTIKAIADGWFAGATSFQGGTPQLSSLRLGPSGEYSYTVQTTASTAPYRNVRALTNAFSVALYADVSAMPTTGKAVMMEFGNQNSYMAMLCREGEQVCAAFCNKYRVLGTAASAEAKGGYHLYAATFNPETGDVSLSLDGGESSQGCVGWAVELGNGLQIGSVFNGIDNTAYVRGTGMAIAKVLGFADAFTANDIAKLVTAYPAVETVDRTIACSDLPGGGSTLEIKPSQTLRVQVTTEDEKNGCTLSSISVSEGGAIAFLAADGSAIDAGRVTVDEGNFVLAPYGLPAVASTASSEEIAALLDDSIAADSLKSNLDTPDEYNAYRSWVADKSSLNVAASSPNAWASFALDAPELLAKELTDDDLTVEALEPDGDGGTFALEVAIEDVAIGDSATSERLIKAFGLEGAPELDTTKFSGENVTLEAGAPVNGKVKLTARPKENGGAFFMRVKLNK